MRKSGFWGILILILGLTFLIFFFAMKNNPTSEGSGAISSAISHSGSQILGAKSNLIPKTRRFDFGVVIDDYANKTGTITGLEQILQSRIAILSIYKHFGSSTSNLDLTQLKYAKSSGKKLLLAWEPWNPDEGMNQTTDYLKSIISGQQDSYIHTFAKTVKSFGNPTEIRFGQEMNSNWYPWSNRPDDYKTAYRHIVTLFRQDKVSNVKWMWSINAQNAPKSPISDVSQYYPGEDVVDVIGIDGFNFATQESGGWKSFNQIFEPAYAYLTNTYHKPVSISETASAELGGDKAVWVTGMFNTLNTSFPEVYELIWFNLIKEADWRINSTHSSQQAFILNFSN